MIRLALLGVSAAFAVASSASAAVIWDESSNGALSSNHLAPTPVTIKAGTNTFKGSLTDVGMDLYHDYVTFEIPKGYALMKFNVEAQTSVKPDGGMVIGLAPGKTCQAAPNGQDSDTLLGFAGIKPSTSIGRDILPALALLNSSAKNKGFKIPLKSGDYTLWIQDYDTLATYQFSLVLEKAVAPVVSVTGQKVIGKKVAIKVKASGSATKMSYRVGTKGAFKKVSGGSPWMFTASHLKVGKNVVTLKAEGDFGTTTKRLPVVVKK